MVVLIGAAPKSDPPPDWAFVIFKAADEPAPQGKFVTVPGSELRIALTTLDDPFNEPDWFPQDHPKMPDVVAHGHAPKLWGCGYCHMPTGIGGPESAALDGLPAGYIEQQFTEFRAGRRGCPVPKDEPCARAMQSAAATAGAAEVEAAADYFSKIAYRSRVHAIEAAIVPKTQVVDYTLAAVKGAGEVPIGPRILELPDNPGLEDDGDWRTPITAYVPPGSIARGKALVESGAGALPCAACHGTHLQGAGLVPPLAGRPPSYIARQL